MGTFFKAAQATLAVVIMLAVSYFGFNLITAEPNLQIHTNVPVSQMSLQQKASHMAFYLDDKGVSKGLCTVTAIGPHALMTATHCNDGKKREPSTQINLDLAERAYTIVATATDGEDHDIYLIDGPALTQFITVKSAPVALNQHVTFYGFGQGVYPSTVKQGVRHSVIEDPSEIDAAERLYEFDVPVVPGDSGSAIYDDKGDVVALVTFHCPFYNKLHMFGYALAFTQKQLDVATNFDPAVDSTYPGGHKPLPEQDLNVMIGNILAGLKGK